MPSPGAGGRAIFFVFGICFAGVGIAVLTFLWSQPFGGFGSPPLFFRVFGSFVAIPFVAMGGFTAITAVTAKSLTSTSFRTMHRDLLKQAMPRRSAKCQHCGAPFSSGVEVSPSGDKKCSFCDGWTSA